MAHLPRRPLPSYSPQVIQRSKHREVGVYAKADDKADLAFLKDMAFKHPVAVHAFVRIRSNQSYPFGDDPLYRLTDLSQGSSVLEHFDDDATGNRIAANLGGAAQSYAYSHRLQSINGETRDYDRAFGVSDAILCSGARWWATGFIRRPHP